MLAAVETDKKADVRHLHGTVFQQKGRFVNAQIVDIGLYAAVMIFGKQNL